MRFKTAVFIGLIFCVFTGQAESLENLIDQVYAKAKSYQDDSTYTCHVTGIQEKTDKNWQAEETTIIEKKMIRNGPDVTFKVLSARFVKKGKETDITDETRKEMEKSPDRNADDGTEQKEKREISLGQDDLVPFGPERRPLFEITQLADTLAEGITWQRLKTVAKDPAENRYNGIYTIHPVTRAIQRIVLHPSKNPKFLKSLTLDFRLSEKPGNRYTIDQVSSKVFVDLLVKKIRVQSEEIFSEYLFD